MQGDDVFYRVELYRMSFLPPFVPNLIQYLGLTFMDDEKVVFLGHVSFLVVVFALCAWTIATGFYNAPQSSKIAAVIPGLLSGDLVLFVFSPFISKLKGIWSHEAPKDWVST